MLKAGVLVIGYFWGRGLAVLSPVVQAEPSVQGWCANTFWGYHCSVLACCFLVPVKPKVWRKYPPCMDVNSAWGPKPASLISDFPKCCQQFIPLPSSHSYGTFWQPFEYVLTCRVFCALNTTTKCWHVWNLVYIATRVNKFRHVLVQQVIILAIKFLFIIIAEIIL